MVRVLLLCGRNDDKLQQLKEQKKQLIEQRQRQDEKLTTFAHQMVRIGHVDLR